MSYNPILVNDVTDSTLGPIIGPLRVAPNLYKDGINGMISDPGHTRLDERFVAFKDSNGSDQVCFSKFAPYWRVVDGIPRFERIQLINANRIICDYVRDGLLFPKAGQQHPLEGRTDGNGYFYIVGGGGETTGTNGWGGVKYQSRILQVRRDGTTDSLIIDWRSIAPDSDWFGNPYDSFGAGVSFWGNAIGTLSQQDGVLVRAFVTIPGTTGWDGGHYVYAHVDENLNVGASWWAPMDGGSSVARVDPYVQDFGFTRVQSPLPAGYIGFRQAGPKLYKVDQSGTIAYSAVAPGAGSIFNFQMMIFHTDGSFWASDTSTPPTQYAIASDFSNMMPAWFDQNFGFPLVSSAPLSSPGFRLISTVFESPDLFYRVYDNVGSVLVEKQLSSNLNPEPTLARRHGGAAANSVQQTVDNCFLYERFLTESTAPGCYKFAADNLVGSLVGPGGGIWSRGQFAHFNYDNWPVNEGI